METSRPFRAEIEYENGVGASDGWVNVKGVLTFDFQSFSSLDIPLVQPNGKYE